MQPFHSRLAPTPSGFLHVGNAFSFILTWLLVRKTGGTLLLRIDDLDSDRVRPEYIADIFENLDWLGLDWDRGPQTPDEFVQAFSQKHRLDLYYSVLHRLRTETGLVYGCDCSRTKIQSVSVNGLYPGICRNKKLSLNAPEIAWRIHVPENTRIMPNELRSSPIANRTYLLDALMGDFVIRRKDGVPAYQVASLADDLHFGINAVVRGVDLHTSTAAQLWLAQLLDATAFAQATFYHHPLITDSHGQKLSKSAGATSLRAMREVLPSPQILFQNMAQNLGLPHRHVSKAEDLLQVFDFQLPDRFTFVGDPFA